MTNTKDPDWVQNTLKKFVTKKATSELPEIKRNMQAEVNRLQSVIDTVSKNQIPKTEMVRLRNKAQDLLNVLNSKQ